VKTLIMLMLFLEQARGHHVGDPCNSVCQFAPDCPSLHFCGVRFALKKRTVVTFSARAAED